MASSRSNEEIIENLTKDLGSSRLQDTNDTRAHSSESGDNIQSTAQEIASEADSYEFGPSKSSAESENVDDTEFIDEDSLKDRDTQLTEEQLNEFRDKALEDKANGNEQFKSQLYIESVISYSNGLKICPLTFTNDRSILYANRAASKHKLDRKESAIQDCSKAIDLNSNYLKAYLRRATLYEETDKLDEALADCKKILELDPGNKEALAASARLPDQINERNEKLKTEMMGKLKDLGNLVLRPFGLSTNNFKMTQDPNSGGYSINFVQNP